MKDLKKDQQQGQKIKFKIGVSAPPLRLSRQWIPCEEFCEIYRIPKTRPARQKQTKYPTSKLSACRKCCERLAAKGLIITRKIDGRLYVSHESAATFGEMA